MQSGFGSFIVILVWLLGKVIMKKLRVLVLYRGNRPSTRLRISECLTDFHENGVDVTLMPIGGSKIKRLRLLMSAREYDAVVIQKRISIPRHELVILRWANPRIVFDMDDAVMFEELDAHDRASLTGENFKKFLQTINHCAGAVAGNRFLARFAEANCKNVALLPTPIDTRRYFLKTYETTGDGTVVVGWIGLKGNLRYLLKLSPVFQRLAQRYPHFRLKIVSNEFIDIPGVPVIKEAWSLETEIASLVSFDIGIMPLDDSLWSIGKGGYKILQYMGVGVPAVASPVGINQEIIRHGVNGFLADSEEEWFSDLSRLIADKDMRRRMGKQGRITIEQEYSLKYYARDYVNFLRRVCEYIP